MVSVMSLPMTPDFVAGVLDAAAIFRPEYARPRLVLRIPNDELRERFKARWGGSDVEQRLIIESPQRLRDLLKAWEPLTRTRDTEISSDEAPPRWR
jgi:hypothetical protein